MKLAAERGNASRGSKRVSASQTQRSAIRQTTCTPVVAIRVSGCECARVRVRVCARGRTRSRWPASPEPRTGRRGLREEEDERAHTRRAASALSLQINKDRRRREQHATSPRWHLACHLLHVPEPHESAFTLACVDVSMHICPDDDASLWAVCERSMRRGCRSTIREEAARSFARSQHSPHPHPFPTGLHVRSHLLFSLPLSLSSLSLSRVLHAALLVAVGVWVCGLTDPWSSRR